MTIQEWFYLFGIIGTVVSLIFSGFMMFSMLRVKNNAEKITKQFEEFGNQVEQVLPMILSKSKSMPPYTLDEDDLMEMPLGFQKVTASDCKHEFMKHPNPENKTECCIKCGVVVAEAKTNF